MASKRRRDGSKERQWRGLMRKQSKSGLSIRDFCRSAGISEPSFYAWRRELKKRDSHRRVPASSQNPGPFLPVHIALSEHEPSALEILLENGRRLRVPPGFDPQALARFVAALEQRPC